MGYLFPTIDNGGALDKQPRFISTFDGSTNLSGKIPEQLFEYIHGTPVPQMFFRTFADCSKLDGPLPISLFDELNGNYTQNMFTETFSNCRNIGTLVDSNDNITNYIPSGIIPAITANRFSNTDEGMFQGTSLVNACPANMYKTDVFANLFEPKVQCTQCPEGTTSQNGATDISDCVVLCESGVWLHIGEEKMCLYRNKPDGAALVVQIGANKYYVMLTLRTNESNIPITKGSIQKMHIEYNGNTYNAHDASALIQ